MFSEFLNELKQKEIEIYFSEAKSIIADLSNILTINLLIGLKSIEAG